MKITRRSIGRIVVSLTVLLLVCSWVAPESLSQAPLAAVEDLLRSASIPSTDRILTAFQLGTSVGTLSPDSALLLTDRLLQSSGLQSDKETVFLTLATTLELALPVERLIDKVIEGLSRRVALSAIRFEIEVRARLQASVRDVLFSKGIFVGGRGSGGTSLPQDRFDLLVMHIADALGDYREGGGSPLDYPSVSLAVQQRLTYLGGSVIPMADVELALARIEPTELGSVLLGALE